MRNKAFDEKYFENILCQVLDDIEIDEVKHSAQIYEQFKTMPPLKTSLYHQRRMKKIVKIAQRQPGLKHRYIKRIVATAAAAVIVIGASNVIAGANIAHIFNWLGFYSQEYIDISLSTSYTQKIIEGSNAWYGSTIYVPTLIPEDYALNNISATPVQIRLTYSNTQNDYFQFVISTLGDNTVFSADNKHSSIQKVKINGWQGIFFRNESVNILTFNTNEYLFRLESNALDRKN